MANVVVIGAQWGDEGKGKVVDIYTEFADDVVRYQGGNNAGHSLVVGNEKVVLHLIPSGILHDGKRCVIGNGVVLDPEVFIMEITRLKANGYLKDDRALLLSEALHIIMPYHKRIDIAREKKSGSKKIGTTGRGIGPAYEDKIGRRGIRLMDLLDEKAFTRKVQEVLEEKNLILQQLLGDRNMVLLFVGLVAAAYFGLGATVGVWGFLFYFLLTCMRGLRGPMMLAHTQSQSPSANRAATLSLQSVSFRLFFVATGPLVGMLADSVGVRQTFHLLCYAFLITLPLLSLLFLKHAHGPGKNRA